jgi:hypothetical protein
VWPKLDALAARYPGARVAGAPIAGMYGFAWPYTGPNATAPGLASFSPDGVRALYALYGAEVGDACRRALGADASACMLANYSQNFVASPVFVTEALTDAVQLTAHDDVPAAHRNEAPELTYITAWAANMSAALAPSLGAGSPRARGGFAAACWTHTGFSAASPLVRGVSFLQAAAAWYARTADAAAYKLADDCGAPYCNPSCPPGVERSQ